MYCLREGVADAFSGDAGNLGDREMYDPPLVWIEGAGLLIETGLLYLLREQLRHLPQLDVLALAVLEGIDEHAPVGLQAASVRHIDDVLQRLERLTAMAHEQLGVVAGDVDPRAVRRLLEIDRGGDAERGRESVQELDDRLCGIRHGCLFRPSSVGPDDYPVTTSPPWQLQSFRPRLASFGAAPAAVRCGRWADRSDSSSSTAGRSPTDC